MVLSPPLFIAGLPPEEQGQLHAVMRPWQAAQGATVYREGEPLRTIYLLDSGQVRFEICAVDGRTAMLGLVAEGGCFGELESIDKSPALGTAVVNKSAHGWQMDIEDFHAVLPRTPAFTQLMLRTAVRSARIHNLLYRSAMLMATGERLAIAMLFMARHATVSVDGEQGALIEVTQDTLAQLVGLSRQCVSKHLKQWEQSGWIALQYGGIRLINRGGLTAQHQALERLLAW